MYETQDTNGFRKLAKEEVSKIITAYAEGWGEQRHDLYVTRLSNIFDSIKKGLIRPEKMEAVNENDR